MSRNTLLAALVLMAGCAGARREAAAPVYRTAGAGELVASYNDNASKIPSLSANIEMTIYYTEEGRRKRYGAEAWLDVEKPGRLRLKHDAIGRELFYVVSDGSRFWVALDRSVAGGEDTVYTGAFKDLEKESFLRPDRLLAAFSLLPLPPAGTSQTVFQAYNDRYVLEFLEGTEALRVLARATFDRTSLSLARYEVFDEESRLALDVEYQKYMNVSGAEVPELVSIDWPLDGMSVAAKVEKAKVGGELPARLWQFQWRKDARVIELAPAMTIHEGSDDGAGE